MKEMDRDNRELTENEKEEMNQLLTDKEFNKKMGQLQSEYKNIKIPENLGVRVVQTIKDTHGLERIRTDVNPEEERGDGRYNTDRIMNDDTTGEKNNMDKRKKGKRTAAFYLIRTSQTAAAALLAITFLANTSAQTAYAMSQIPVIGAITRVVTFRTYEKQEGNSEARVEVPKIEAGEGSGILKAADQVNQSIEEYTNRIIAKFEEELKTDGKEVNKGLFTGYQVLSDNNRFFTLEIETDEIMASGYQTVKIYNIDKQTDQILALKDLFPEGTDYVTLLSGAAKEEMRKNMKEDEGKVYFLDDEIGDNFETIKEDQNFYINDSGRLVLVFDEYEAAPGYMGVVQLEMPQSIYQADGL